MTTVIRERPFEAIAIVGIAAELPSGEHSTSNFSHEELFRLLLEKKETYQKIPIERLDVKRWVGDGPGQIKVDTGSFLKNLADFDHAEFGVTAKDARAMAVSTRKLLKLAFLSLLNSGIDYRGEDVGCFMSAVDFDILSVENTDVYDARGSFAGIPCMVANKVSYHLDLLGPSVPLNTACSSSLTALHLAVQSIRNGECKAAVVGGCQLNHRLADWITYSQSSVLAPDGKCKPFNASADGFSRGEGAAVIVIKPLEDAIRDKDHIYASILGSGINSSGLGGPVSAPVARAQKDAMIRAFRGTGRHPSEVDYVEMHATGTAAGDPTEANWVGESFRRESDIIVGSIKGNIGHLEITAFLASLLKVCSMFETGLIPPNINLGTLNPKVKWDEYQLRVLTDVAHFNARHHSRRALVSIASSGIGGSNGHVVVEAPPRQITAAASPEKRPLLLTVGGLSIRSILAICDKVSSNVGDKTPQELAALAAISGRRTRQLVWRSIALYSPGDSSLPAFSFPVLIPRNRSPLVFVFAGQGPQYLEMGRELFQTYEAFRNSILSLDEVYKREVGESFIDSTGLFNSAKYSSELSSTWSIGVTLPAMAMIQVAMVDLLRSINIFPDIVIGHSAGETAMLYASGAASKELVMALAIARGLAMTAVEEAGGKMAALSCSPSKAMSIFMDVAGGASNGLDIACYNTPESVTIAGRNDLVELAVKSADKQGIFARVLRTNTAVHSYLMDVCQSQYTERVQSVFDRYGPVAIPTTAVYSTNTGRAWRDAFTAEYYWNSARDPVLFGDATSELLKDYPNATFLEISPHPVLSSYIRTMAPQNSTVLCLMERPKVPRNHHETSLFLSVVGQLLLKGFNMIDFASLNGFSVIPHKSFEFLNYPFSKKQVPYLPDQASTDKQNGNLNVPKAEQPKIFKVNGQTYPDLVQHVIKGEPIMPATGFIEMGLSQGAKQIRDVQFHSMLSLSSHDPLLVNLEVEGDHWSIVSVEATGKKARRVHAEGYYSKQVSEGVPKALAVSDIMERCVAVDTKDFYSELRYFADYGPIFQRIVACYKGEEEAIVKVRGSGIDIRDSIGKYVIHPAILDSCLHLAVHRMFTGDWNNQVYYLPSSVDSVVVHDALIKSGMPEELFVYTSFKTWKPDTLTFDFTVADNKGTPLCQLTGFSLSKHSSAKKVSIERCYDVQNEKLPVEPINVDGNGVASLNSKSVVVHYVRGGEMEVKTKLLPLNRYDKLDIWFLASNDTNGAAARGLTRTLRREIPAWNIHLVFFPTETPIEYRVSALPLVNERAPSEDEIIIDGNGDIFVPRFTAYPTNKQSSEKDNSKIKFYTDKAYLLMGGVGSLGVRIALWMYEHGARHIILTSRKGLQSGSLQDTSNRRTLSYLQGLSDLSIRVERCDSSSADDVKSLLRNVDRAIGGCLLLGVVLSDRSFFSQTAESYTVPFVAKTQAFLSLKEAIDISGLDFLISFSTISTFGNIGQTNYASANTGLDEMIRTLPNAFSMITPLILDSSIIPKAGGSLSHYLPWGVSTEDLCEYLEDALLKLKNGPFWLYIPDFDWGVVNKYLGRSSLYDHLVTHDDKRPAKLVNGNSSNLIRTIVMKYVDVDPEDFFPSAPLSSYGLDSLTAAQLSSDLEPYITITQLQLLADISLDDILKRAGEVSQSTNVNGDSSDTIRAIVMKYIDVDPEDFFPSAPLSSYGLDSITAAQLSSDLEPFLTITQLQLLADTSLDDILKRAGELEISKSTNANGDSSDVIRTIVMKYIDVDPEDFFPSAPLSSYGLDSITAAQLSSDLEPFLTITQLQLLADVSLDNILKRVNELTGKAATGPSNGSSKFSWSELNKVGETLVQLRGGEGIPLILIHGASGDIIPFKPLQDLFTTPLWTIQLTPDVPTQSVPEIARFYYDAIKKLRPKGPYRLGGYSGTSMITYEVAHLIEGNGDELIQFALIDHFPTLFHSSVFLVDEETVQHGTPSRKLISQVMGSICELYRQESNPSRRKIANELSAALEEGKATPYMQQYITATEQVIAMTAKFMLDLAGGDIAAIPEAVRTWVRQIKARLTLYMARDGFVKCIAEDERDEWKEFRAPQYLDDLDIVMIKDSHFSMFQDLELAKGLEKGYSA